MNAFYGGSQFNDTSDEHIDPRLRAFGGQTPWTATPVHSTRQFDRDVETATGVHSSASQQHNWYRSNVYTPNTPVSLSYSTPTSSSAHRYSNGLQTPSSNNGGWTQSNRKRRRKGPSHFIPHRAQQVGSIANPVETRNPFAILGHETNRHRYLPQQSDVSNSATSQRLATSQQYYATPPGSGSRQGDMMTGTPVLPSQQGARSYSEVVQARSTMLQSAIQSLPADPRTSNDLHRWNRSTYNTGDRTHWQTGGIAQDVPHVSRQISRPVGTDTSTHPMICATCDKSFKTEGELNHHIRCHERKYPCSACHQSFAYAKDQRRHEKTHDDTARTLKCIVAGCKYSRKGFKREDHRKRHMSQKHPGILL